MVIAEAGPSAPVVVSSAPAAAPGPLALLVEPSASAPAGDVADPPVPVPGAPIALPASVPGVPAPASASSPKAASATTGSPAPSVAPSAAGQSAPAVMLMAPAGQPSCPVSPDGRLYRPHSPVLHQERTSGPRGRGGGGAYCPRVTIADLQQEVSRAVREERAAQSQIRLMRASPAHEAPRQAALPFHSPPSSAPPPQDHAPMDPAPAVSTPAPGSRLRLPPIPPVAGVAV
ncbi:unnamed protein product [Closterium sp. Naga37s-1]|nr:unnamed protein product [Closterium sp. Naga37s-1]